MKKLLLGPRETDALWSLVLLGIGDVESDESNDTWSREQRKVMYRVVEKVRKL